MNIRVILVSREGHAKQAYLNAIKPLGIQIDTVSTFTELHSALAENLYSGVMVDLVTKIKGSREEKGLIHQILELYPVLQLKWEDKTGLIQTLCLGQSKGSGTLKDFIYEECGSFTARAISSTPRRDIHFNVILSRNANFSQNSIEKTVTVNISKEGCFIYSVGKWERTFNCWMKIKELNDDTPILGEVKWAIPWGKVMKFPGIGIKFENIRKNQLEEICLENRV